MDFQQTSKRCRVSVQSVACGVMAGPSAAAPHCWVASRQIAAPWLRLMNRVLPSRDSKGLLAPCATSRAIGCSVSSAVLTSDMEGTGSACSVGLAWVYPKLPVPAHARRSSNGKRWVNIRNNNNSDNSDNSSPVTAATASVKAAAVTAAGAATTASPSDPGGDKPILLRHCGANINAKERHVLSRLGL